MQIYTLYLYFQKWKTLITFAITIMIIEMKNYLSILMLISITSCLFAQESPITDFNEEVFKENFSSPQTQFDVNLTTENYFVVDDGDLFLSRNNKSSEFTLFSKTPFNEDSYKLKTSIKIIPSSDNMSFVGVLLNTQLDGNGTVSIEINSKREYRIRQIINGQSKYLSGKRENKGWVSSEKLKENNEFNYIDIVSYNGKIDVYFNFKYENTFVSSEYTKGRFGIIVGPKSQSRIDFIHVDKLAGKISKQEYNNTNDKLLKLEADFIKLNKSLSSSKRKISDISIQKVELDEELKQKKQELSKIEKSNQNLKEKTTNLEQELNKNKVANSQLQKNNTLINEKNTSLSLSLEEKTKELSKIQSSLNESTVELNKKTIEVSTLSKKSKSLQEEVNKLTNENNALKNSNNNFTNDQRELNRKVVNQDEKLNKLKTQLTTTNQKLNNAEKSNVSSNKIIEELNEQINNLNSNFSGIKSELNKKITSQDNKIKNLEKSKSNLSQKVEKLNGQVNNVSSKNKKLTESLTASDKKIKIKEDKIINLEAKMSSLQSKNNKVQTINSKLNNSNNLLSDSIKNINITNSNLSKKAIELENLIIKYNHLKASNDSNESELERIRVENEKLVNSIEQQKIIAAQFAESYRFELEKSKLFQKELLSIQSEFSHDNSNLNNKTYRVQLGLFDQEIDVEGLESLTKINTQNNQFIYISGKFNNYADARNHLLKVNNLGFKDAYIVKF